jgi:hypothetical protein
LDIPSVQLILLGGARHLLPQDRADEKGSP